ncbi:ABC transporter permease [bacterium]|nr:ABC transporter permease [bacterium]
MRLTWFLALRQLGDPRRGRAVTLTALVAMAGIAVGVLALTVILSVMNGLESELRRLINDGEAHIELRPGGGRAIADPAPLLQILADRAELAAAAPFVRSEVLAVALDATGYERLETATLTGIDPGREAAVTGVLAMSYPDFTGFAPHPGWILPDGDGKEPGILLGEELARNLQLGLGERLRLLVPDASTGSASDLDSLRGREAWFRLVGLVDAGLYEFNATRAFADLRVCGEFLQVTGRAQGLGLRCVRPELASAVAESLLALPALAGYRAETWQERNRVLFEAMHREKVMMYLFLLLTVAVASLGIVSALTLMVSAKRAELGILRTLGLSRGGVLGLVVLEGWLVGLVGVLVGLLGGWLLGLYLQVHPLRIPWDLFVLETVPILLNPIDFLRVGTITLAVCLLAALYPGWEAARLDPIAAIRSL